MTGRGQPRKRASDKLSRRISTAFTPSEKVEIEEYAKKEGLTEAQVMRRGTMMFVRKNKDDKE